MTTGDALREQPLISVVIPTAGRAVKLRYTMETVMSQENASFEVIVHDNHSADGTAEVVAKWSDTRVRYFQTSERLSMTENWEAAVSRVRGKYALLIGDDDAIVPGGLAYLEACIGRYGASAYWWKSSLYNWPRDNEAAWIETMPVRGRSRELRTRDVVKLAARTGSMRYLRLPMLYHSAVSTEALNSMRARLGKVFDSTSPDVFMAFALPPFASTFVDVGCSVTVKGSSDWVRSIRVYGTGNDPYTLKMKKFFNESQNYQVLRRLHPCVPDPVNHITETILAAMEKNPEYYRDIDFNFEYLYALARRHYQFAGVGQLLGLRREIRKYHRFNPTRFCFNVVLQFCFTARASVMRVLRARRAAAEFASCPSNIAEYSRSCRVRGTG